MIGNIVYSKAGRDKGCFMAVVGEEDGFMLVCDGRQRPVDRPKRKNIKHLSFTSAILCKEQLSTNRLLKKALDAYKADKEEK